MNMRKLTATLLAGALCLSALAGCQAAPAATSAEPSKTEGASSEAAAEGEASQATADGPSWKKDTSPITLEWFVAYDWYGKKFNPETNVADKKLLEDTGVTIKISTGDIEKYNTLIATQSLPDIVTYDAMSTQRKLLENNQQVLPLDDLMKEHAPDLNVPESMIDWYRNPDGHWYSFASFYYGPERTNPDFGGAYVIHNNNFVRTDILKQINMTMDDLKTKEGFMKALVAVKEQKISYDGKPVTPFIGADPNFFFEQFGGEPEDADGNLVNKKRTPEYLEALLYFNEMYSKGLFTDEEFTMDTQQRETKVSSGAVFAANGWMTVQNPRKALYSADPNALMMYCGQIEGGDNGKKPAYASINAAGWTGTMITKNCKDPARAVQLFSYLSQEEMVLDDQYGTDTYDIVDGKVKKRPETTKEFEENFQAATSKYKLDIGYFEDWTITQKYYPAPETVYEQDQYDMERDPNLTIYDDKCFADVNPDGGTELASVKERIDAYWKQAQPKIIMAASAEDCKKEYELAIQEMDTLGMKDLDTYMNERFQENKKRLGIERAFTRP